jgi:hypothetical protein
MEKILFFLTNGIVDMENLQSIVDNCPKDWKFYTAPVLDPDTNPNRESHLIRFIKDTNTYKNRAKLINRYLLEFKPDLVLATLDWHPLPGQWIEEANKLNIPTAVVVHEGFFPVKERWYSCSCMFTEKEFKRLSLKMPNIVQPPTKAKAVGCWSEYQKNIFIDRGADPKSLFVTGQPRLDKFILKTHQKVSSDRFNDAIGNINRLPVVTYCCQAMDTDEHSLGHWAAQRSSILELLKVCKKHN